MRRWAVENLWALLAPLTPEERAAAYDRAARICDEVSEIAGRTPEGAITRVRITPEDNPAANFAFDVTPARLVSGLITERGLCPASRDGLLALYPDQRDRAAG